jgi:phosphoglycerate dehydrogenase-like enzyme
VSDGFRYDAVTMKQRALINTVRANWERVFSEETRANLHRVLDFDERLIPDELSEDALLTQPPDASVALSTWGAVPYSDRVLNHFQGLELVLYGAGSAKGFVTESLVARGIPVCTAVHLNAQPVAEFTLGLILTSLKNVFSHHHAFLAKGAAAWAKDAANYPGGYYRTKVGIVGLGRISRILLRLLEPFEFVVAVSDKYLSDEEAERLGVEKESLEDLMSTSDVVTLHHANIPENWNLINRSSLELMKDGARFINTSRGKLVNEEDLVAVLETGRITAFLDVTHPEPPEEGHAFYRLENCILTPHVAGSVGNETFRMGEYCYREYLNWRDGRPLENQIDLATLENQA